MKVEPVKRIVLILVLTGFVFLYLEQRIALIRLSYSQARLSNQLRKELLREEEFTYKIALLENPGLLERKLLAFNPEFTPADSVRVIKLAYREERETEAETSRGRVSYAQELP